MIVEELLEGVDYSKAMREVRRIAGELQIASSELLLRYSRALQRMSDNGARAVTQLELAMNLPRGKLKGFDSLYAALQP